MEELKARPLPEGVDPARIEKFLNKEEFLVSGKYISNKFIVFS